MFNIACRCCSNLIFIMDLTPVFNGLGKDNYKTEHIKHRLLTHPGIPGWLHGTWTAAADRGHYSLDNFPTAVWISFIGRIDGHDIWIT